MPSPGPAPTGSGCAGFRSESHLPASPQETAAAGKRLQDVPASVEEWASYSCPEGVTALFRRDDGDFTINPSSIRRPVSDFEGRVLASVPNPDSPPRGRGAVKYIRKEGT